MELDIPKSTVHDVLHKDLKMKAYKIHLTQHLLEEDYGTRLDWCKWIHSKFLMDKTLIDKITFSDEATFHISGKVNRHNCRIWGTEDPKEVFEYERDSPKTNVWCAMNKERIFGPYFFTEKTVNGASYLDMLQNFFIPLLRRLGILKKIFFQQDGAPPHYALDVRSYLNKTFGDEWMGRGGPNSWPPRSPDLTPLDFYLWGYVKSKVYATKPRDLKELKERITTTIQGIPQQHLHNVIASFQHRVQHCIDRDGGHVEI
jgi:hypothetical protein